MKHDFKIGDEIWWFNSKIGFTDNKQLKPGSIQLVHDVIVEIYGGIIICWHGNHKPEDIWGKTRQEAWSKLKNEIEKWGPVE